MYCAHCGNKIPDDSLFCPRCGQPCEPAGGGTARREPEPSPREPQQDPYYDNGGYPPEPVPQHSGGRGPGKGIIIAVIVAACAAAVGAAAFFLMNDRMERDTAEAAAKPGKVTVATPSPGETAAPKGATLTPAAGEDAAAGPAAEEASSSVSASAASASAAEEAGDEAAAAVEEKEDYQLAVTQYDISDYPKVKLYVQVIGENGEPVTDLVQQDIELRTSRSAGEAVKAQTIDRAVLLNENEGLSTGLIADVSASMSDEQEVMKSILTEFVNSVQFDKNDLMEYVEFSTDAYICNSFTNDAAALTSSIAALVADGNSTRLYDTLINEIERIRSQQNAKCVIAFTDGEDNDSVNSYEDVADFAAASGVPVYLIGIGNVYEEGLRYIADCSGGRYYGIDQIDELIEVYKEIYRRNKQVYCVEFTAQDADAYDKPILTEIWVRSARGEALEAVPVDIDPMEYFENLYTRYLIAGEDCQIKDERNLLDSGLLLTTEEAYANPSAVAYQSQEAIKNGGSGSSRSRTYFVLMEHEVLKLEKDGNDFILYGRETYDISKYNTYARLDDVEKQAVRSEYGNSVADDREFRIHESRDNYEKLRIVKDSDGRWKIYTREYVKPDGSSGIQTNEVYEVE